MTDNKEKSGGLLKHSSIYAIGDLTRQIVGLVMLPFYTRYLLPSDYGVVGLLTLSMSIIEPFLGARLGNAILKFYYEEKELSKRNQVISSAFIVTAAVSIVAVAIIYLTRNSISSNLFGSTDYAMAVGVFGWLFLTQALEYYGLTFIRMQQKPWLFLYLSLGKLFIQISLNIVLIVFLKLGVMGMVISNVGASALLSAVGTGYALKHSGFKLNTALAKELLKFSAPLWFSGLTMLYITSSNRFFIRLFGSLDQVGLYELAARLGGIVILMIWGPFYLFWETEQFKIYRNEAAKDIFKNTFVLIFLVMAVAANGLSLFSTPLIIVMADQKFHDSFYAVPYIIIAHLFMSLATFVSFGFMASGKTSWIGRINLATAVAATAINAALIPWLGFIGAAIALMLTFALQFLACNFYSKRFFVIEIKISLIFFTTALIGAAHWAQSLITSFDTDFFRSLFLSILIFIISSLAIVVIYYQSVDDKTKLLEEISGQLRNRLPRAKWLCDSLDRHISQSRRS